MLRTKTPVTVLFDDYLRREYYHGVETDCAEGTDRRPPGPLHRHPRADSARNADSGDHVVHRSALTSKGKKSCLKSTICTSNLKKRTR